MDPLANALGWWLNSFPQAQARAIGGGDVVSNLQGGTGSPQVFGSGAATPGVSYAPQDPYAQLQALFNPTTTGLSASSPLWQNPVFSQLFPSTFIPTLSAFNQPSPSAVSGQAPVSTGSNANPSSLFDLGGSPGGGDPGVGVATPGVSGYSNFGDFGTAISNAISGANQGGANIALDALGANPTVGVGRGPGQSGPFAGLNSQGNSTGLMSLLSGNPQISLGNIPAIIGMMTGYPIAAINALAGAVLGLGQGSPTRGGDFSGPTGGLFGFGGPSNPNADFSGNNQSLSDTARDSSLNAAFDPAQLADPTASIASAPPDGVSPNMGLYSGNGNLPSTFSGFAPGYGGFGQAGRSINEPDLPDGTGLGSNPGDAPGGPGTGSAAGPGVGAGPAAGASSSSGVGPTGGVSGPGIGEGEGAPGPGDGGGGGGGAGGGAGSLLCNYCLGNGSYDQSTAKGHRRVFDALAEKAFRSNPALKQSFGHYQKASRQIIDKLDTLPTSAQRASLQDLHQNLVKPFHAAAKAGDVKGAARILRAQTLRLAKQHGVSVPKDHITFSEQHLGPVGAPAAPAGSQEEVS